jgi:hypothetical protein
VKYNFVKTDEFECMTPCFVIEDGVVVGFHAPLAQIDVVKRSIVIDFRDDKYCILRLPAAMEPIRDDVRMMRLAGEWFIRFGEVRETDGDAHGAADLPGLKDKAKAYGRLP